MLEGEVKLSWNQRELNLGLERVGREKVDHRLPPGLFPSNEEQVPVLISHFLNCFRWRTVLGLGREVISITKVLRLNH